VDVAVAVFLGKWWSWQYLLNNLAVFEKGGETFGVRVCFLGRFFFVLVSTIEKKADVAEGRCGG